MAICFKKNFLAVGLRKSDWTIVWFKPTKDPEKEDEDGGAALTFYKQPSDKNLYREPMDGEIDWFPWYELKTMPADNLPVKRRLHAQFLTDAHRYCQERDRDANARLEQELDNPLNRRWDAWFIEAKRWKRGKIRRTAKKQPAANWTKIDIDSSDDSAYESDTEVNMPPPRRPVRNSNGKRKQGSNRGAANGRSKRPRTNDTISRASDEPRPSETPDSTLFVTPVNAYGASSYRRNARSQSILDGRDGGDDLYGSGNESDEGESTYTRSKPSPHRSSSAAQASSSDTAASSFEAESYQAEDGLGSFPPSLTRAGSRRTGLPLRNLSGGASPLTTPPTTNGNVSHQGGDTRSASGDDCPERGERGSSRNNPVNIDDEEASPSSRMTIGAAAAGVQNLRRIQAENFEGREREYQDPDMDVEEATDQAVRASMAPEIIRASQAPENMSQYRKPQRDYQDASLDVEEAIDLAMRGSVAPEIIRASQAPDNRSQHGGHDGLPEGLRPTTEQEAENRSQHVGEDALPDDILPSTENDD